MKLNRVYLASAALVTSLTTPALAQDAPLGAQSLPESASENQGSEIIVTAQRRAEVARDVPISITALGPEQLQVANVNQLSDTARLTPGLRFDFLSAGSQPSIRGVGTAINTSGAGPNVGTYVDGFFLPNTYVSDVQLMRVENVQVLKGPQGTLFGRNTTGGAILINTADPSEDNSAEFQGTYGRFDSLKLQGYATAGLAQGIAVDIEGLYRRGNGFQVDRVSNTSDIGEYETWSVRAGVKINFSSDVSLLLRYTHSEVDDPTALLTNAYVDQYDTAGFFSRVSDAGRAAYGRSSSSNSPLVYFYAPASTVATAANDVKPNKPISFRANSDSIHARLRADLGFGELTSYTQYRSDVSPFYSDLDATALPLFNLFVGVTDETISQEFVLTSKPGSKLQWTIGANYFQYRDTWDVGASFGGAPFFSFTGSSTLSKSIAAFADLTYQATDQLFLTVGGRFSHDQTTDAYFITNPFGSYTNRAGQPAVAAPGTRIDVPDLKNDSFTPRAVIRFKPSEESSLYASYSRGFKAGILNVGGLSQVPVQPEKIDAYEVGYKYDDRTFAVDLAGFYYNYRNLQVSSFQNGTADIRNAATSRIYGLEAQIRYRVSREFNLYGGASWTHARYRSFSNAPYYSYCDPVAPATSPLFCVPQAFGGLGPGAIAQTSTDASGFRMQRSPDFTANIGASYTTGLLSGSLTLSGNAYYTSSIFFDPSQQFKQAGYALLSLRAEWRDAKDRFNVAIFGDNVTNRRYRTQVLANTLGIGTAWNSPATYGVSVGLKF